jgi:LysR family transcriptional activator of nhaA
MTAVLRREVQPAHDSARGMSWLNYHHLFYFHRVAHAGSIAAASRALRIAHSTLSVQIRELGEMLGGALFDRRGRRLVLTPLGEAVLGYADDIFRLGNELLELADGRAAARASLVVGVVPALPSSLAYRLIEPALRDPAVRLVIRSRSYAVLLEELAAGRMHVVLSDVPPEGPSAHAPLHTHPLGRSRLALYAATQLARSLARGFPISLESAPMILPAYGLGLRRLVDRWLSVHQFRLAS